MLLEDAGAYLYGGTDVVRDVIRAMDREEGFLDEASAISRALDRADSGRAIAAIASSDCEEWLGGSDAPSGCRAVGIGITGGDELKFAVVFASGGRAESAQEDVEDAVEEMLGDVDIEESDVDGEVVALRLVVYGDTLFGGGSRTRSDERDETAKPAAPAPTASTVRTPTPTSPATRILVPPAQSTATPAAAGSQANVSEGRFIAIGAGSSHSCGVRENGEAVCLSLIHI